MPDGIDELSNTELSCERAGSEGPGVPIGQPACVQEFLAKKGHEQDTLFQGSPRHKRHGSSS